MKKSTNYPAFRNYCYRSLSGFTKDKAKDRHSLAEDPI